MFEICQVPKYYVAYDSCKKIDQDIELKAPKRRKLEDPEDLEIKRLEKLLGGNSKKDKSKIADKLNKEYGYEGFGSDFGDFLMKLDGEKEKKDQLMIEKAY